MTAYQWAALVALALSFVLFAFAMAGLLAQRPRRRRATYIKETQS